MHLESKWSVNKSQAIPAASRLSSSTCKADVAMIGFVMSRVNVLLASRWDLVNKTSSKVQNSDRLQPVIPPAVRSCAGASSPKDRSTFRLRKRVVGHRLAKCATQKEWCKNIALETHEELCAYGLQ